MLIKLYLAEPEDSTDGSLGSPDERAWFLSRGAVPLSNEEFLAWKEFLTRSESTGYVYCQHCGMANERPDARRIKDDLLPPDVLALKRQCIEEGRADWFQSLANKEETALFASKGADVFLIAQWGEGSIHAQDEVVQRARAKKLLKRYGSAEMNWSLAVLACGLFVVVLVLSLMTGPRKPLDPHKLAALLSLTPIPVAICIVVFEWLKRKIRRQFAFMF
jgi:hypothetical protein